MSADVSKTTVTVHVEPETLVAIAARVGEMQREKETLTSDDVDRVVANHYDVEHVFSVKGCEQPVGEWLTEHTNIELEEQRNSQPEARSTDGQNGGATSQTGP